MRWAQLLKLRTDKMSDRDANSIEQESKRRRVAGAGYAPVDYLAPPNSETASTDPNSDTRYAPHLSDLCP